MIMKPKAKKFSFLKLFIFGLIMLVLQIATFAGDLPGSAGEETVLKAGEMSEYAQLYTYNTSSPLAETFRFHESGLIALICIGAVIAANFRAKTVSKTVAIGCWSFAALYLIMHLTFAIIDAVSWNNGYSFIQCSPINYGILISIVAAVIGTVAFFSDPVLDIIDTKVEEKRRIAYEAARKAAREEEIESERRAAEKKAAESNAV